MWGGYDYGWGWSMGLGMISMVLFWVLVILGIVVLIKWLIGGPSRQVRETGNRPLEVLKERYARGEIGRDEYEQTKRDLGS
jgi:putative membrane protein